MKSEIEAKNFQLFKQDSQPGGVGCYLTNPSALGINYRRALVPLKFIDYDLKIVNSLLSIILTQTYYNPSKSYIEVFYSLPINPESSIYHFEAQFGQVKLTGIVKEKQQAKKEYEKAKSQGRNVVLGTLDEKNKDIFKLSIGNIPPQTQVTITVSYLQELKVSMNTFYKLIIPPSINPRIPMKIEEEVKFLGIVLKKRKQYFDDSFKWSFKINLKTTKKIKFCQSPSHKMTKISQNNQETEIVLVMEKSQNPIKDFVFLYSTENFQLPSYVIGKTDQNFTLMLSFIPKFCSLNVNDAYKAEIQNKPYEVDIETAKGDYIFFLDRSGSMGGQRIQKAKQALIMFLKSLPEDCYFNVISFGSGSRKMFQNSVKYDKEKLENAKNEIQIMKADMGGTQIYNPLQDILVKQTFVKGYPRHVFLLTDGQVDNTDGVIALVKNNTKFCRVHGIGIGDNVSMKLIEGCAKQGKGRYVAIKDKQNCSNKIIQLLEQTLTPLITKLDLKIEENKQLLQSIVPNPASVPYILKDDLINFYITFSKLENKSLTFQFVYEDSVSKLPYSAKIQVNPLQIGEKDNFPFVDKMAHLKVINLLQQAAKKNNNGVAVQEHMHYVKVKDYKQQCIKYSVKNQVISQFTSFVCIGKELDDIKYQQYMQKQATIIKQHVPLVPIVPLAPFAPPSLSSSSSLTSSTPFAGKNKQYFKAQAPGSIPPPPPPPPSINIQIGRNEPIGMRMEMKKMTMQSPALQAPTRPTREACYNDKLEDIILDANQCKLQQKQINDKMRDIMMDEKEEDERADQLFKQLQMEVNSSKQKVARRNDVKHSKDKKQKEKDKNQQKAQQDQIQKMLDQLDTPIVPDSSKSSSSSSNNNNNNNNTDININADTSSLSRQIGTYGGDSKPQPKKRQVFQEQLNQEEHQAMQKWKKMDENIDAQLDSLIQQNIQWKSKIVRLDQIKQQNKQYKKQQIIQQTKQSKKSASTLISKLEITKLIDLQQPNGSWNNENFSLPQMLKNHLSSKTSQKISTLLSNPKQLNLSNEQLIANLASVIITKIILEWIAKYYKDKQYSLIVKKAANWIKKIVGSAEQKGEGQAVLDQLLVDIEKNVK